MQAIAVVALLVLAVPVSGCMAGVLQSEVIQEAVTAEAEVPEGFEDEVLSLSGRSDVRVGAGGAVVGFCCSGTAPEVFAGVAAELAQAGWSQVESGSDIASTFVKPSGRYRWLFVTCTEVSGEVSVVITNDGYAKEDD